MSTHTQISKPKLLIAASVPLHLYTFWVPYARHFHAQGWQVDGMAAGIGQFHQLAGEFDNIHDVQFVRNPFKNPGAFITNLRATQRQIIDIFQANEYNIVHISTPTAGFLLRYTLRNKFPNLHKIYTAHGFHFFKGNAPLKNLVFHTLEAYVAKWTDTLITINQEDYEAARAFSRLDPRNVQLFPGIGVDLVKYSQGSTNLREELQLSATTPILLMIGEMNKGKRHRDLIQALKFLPNCHVVLAGSGKLQDQLKASVQRNNLQDRVHFLGFRNDIPALINAADILVLPSEREGLPRCIMEAMSIGTPVVACSIRGCKDLLQNQRGLLYPVGNIPELVKAIQTILTQPDISQQLVQNAKVHIPKYALDLLLQQHSHLYKNILRNIPTNKNQ